MLLNHLKIAWRNLLRNKIFAVIKIAGLSIGLMVCMLILLYTKDEISFDRFHAKKEQLYRVVQAFKFGQNAPQRIGVTNALIGEAFKKEIPEVQQFVRINGVAVTVKRNNDVFTEEGLFVDDNFFSVFTFPLLNGDPHTALKDINSIVLSKECAKKYFGTTDVIGKTLQLKLNDEFDNFTISGLAEESPQNSTIKFNMLLPFLYYKKLNQHDGWIGGSLNTFLLLSPQANSKAVENKMQALFDKNTKDQIAKARQEQGIAIKISLNLQPLTDIHLNKSLGPDNGLADGSKSVYSYILTCIAIFILIIACINFINLAIGQSLKRAKEIGIRKVVGSSRRQLIKQFLTESLVVSSIAFTIAIFLTIIILPFFNELANKKLSLSYLSDTYLYIGYFLLLLVTSFIAGFYPSLVLSRFQPVKVLYSKQKLMGKNYIAKALVVLQFALSIFLIIGTFAINAQLNFLLHRDLGYDSKNLVRINLPYSKTSDKLPAIFKSELASESSILSVAARNGGVSITAVKVEGKQIEIDLNRIDENFFPTFKIPIIAGRNFFPSYPSDLTQTVIVNETFAKAAGWSNDEAVGKSIGFMDEKKQMTIVGVIRDYHFRSLKARISPQLFSMDSGLNYAQIWVKIKPENISKTLSLLQNTFKKILPFFPYDYQLMDDINAKNYETETKWKQTISIASVLFIFISCIGLFGLVILSIEQRTKEIGIRKVLGAAVSKILILISKDFIILIAIAFVITVPLGYYAINEWLQDFAYRVKIPWWIFALAGIIVVAIALLTVSFQAIKAAISNPVKSLRME